MKKGQKRTQYTKEQRTAHIEAFMACGKTVAEYARESGIKEQTLHNWVTGRGATKRPEGEKDKNLRVEAQLIGIKKMLANNPHLPTLVAILTVGILSTGVNVAYAVSHIVDWFRGP
jgi:transposase-like protein